MLIFKITYLYLFKYSLHIEIEAYFSLWHFHTWQCNFIYFLFDFINFWVNNSYLMQINRQHEYADKSRHTTSRWLNQQIFILWWTILVIRIEYGDKSNDWFLRLSNSYMNLAATDCPRPLVLSHSRCLSVSFFSFSGAWSRDLIFSSSLCNTLTNRSGDKLS